MFRRPHHLIAATLLAMMLAAGNVARAQETSRQRLPVPNSTAQARVLKDVKQQYKAEYAKRTAGDRIALCKTLLDQVPTYGDDPPKQYVLLREARELAVSGGDLDLAFHVIDETAEMFTTTPLEYKVSAMTEALDRALIPKLQLMEQYLRIADEALKNSDFDMANPATLLADRIARATRNAANIQRVKQTDLRVHALRRELAAISDAFNKLRAHPDDPEASLLVGRFVCFVKGGWEQGLPILSHCSDKRLKELAEKDLQQPSDSASMLEIADGWWDVPDSPQTPARGARERAAFWYSKALPILTGDKKQHAEERIAQTKRAKSGA